MRSWASWRSSSLPRLPVRLGAIEAVTLSMARMSAGSRGIPRGDVAESGVTSRGPPWTFGPGGLGFLGFRRLLTGPARFSFRGSLGVLMLAGGSEARLGAATASCVENGVLKEKGIVRMI